MVSMIDSTGRTFQLFGGVKQPDPSQRSGLDGEAHPLEVILLRALARGHAGAVELAFADHVRGLDPARSGPLSSMAILSGTPFWRSWWNQPAVSETGSGPWKGPPAQ